MSFPKHDVVCQLLETPFSRWQTCEKHFLLKSERPQPQIEFAKNSRKQLSRNFRQLWYQEYRWLCGSFYLNKVFCWPCLLLSTKKTPWNSTGFEDFRNATRSFHKHQDSAEHLKSEVGFRQLKKNARLQLKIYNDNVRLNRQFMQIPIDCVLAKQETAFRGHDEKTSSYNRGNFKELFKLILRNASPEIKNHYVLKIKNNNVFSGDSKTIQNELVNCISEYIQDHIKKDIAETNFYSIQVDDTTDITQKSQCTIIIRFINSQGELVEHFAGFYDVSTDRTAQALFDLIQSVLNDFEYDQKLIAQCYDGASVMSGHLNGLQQKVKEVAPQAIFVHCLAHRLNLILQQSFNRISKCRIFFANISGLPAYFHHSGKRTEMLESIIGVRIPTATNTRWFSNAKIIDTIVTKWEGLKTTLFEKIIANPNFDATSIREAEGFFNKFHDFEFCILALIFHQIFGLTEILFNILQTKSLDINYCSRQITQTKNLIIAKRNDEIFEEIYNKATNKTKDLTQTKRTGATLTKKETFQTYKCLYFEIIDNVLIEFETRFKDLKKIEFVAVADTSKFEEYSIKFPKEALNVLKENYSNIFKNEHRLKNELEIIYSDPQYRNLSLQKVLEILVKNDLKDVFTEAYKLFCLIYTIPSTSSSAERSFSCLKRIKTFLRNSLSQQRLSDLAHIAIEKELLYHLTTTQPFYEDIIDKFALLKNRRIDLIYKK